MNRPIDHPGFGGSVVPCSNCKAPAARANGRGIIGPQMPALCSRCRFRRAQEHLGAIEVLPLDGPDPASTLDAELAILSGLGAPTIAEKLGELLRPMLPRRKASAVPFRLLASPAALRMAGPESLWDIARRLESGDFGAIGRDVGQDSPPSAALLGPGAPPLQQNIIARRRGVGSVRGAYGDLIAWRYTDADTPARVLIAAQSDRAHIDGIDPAPMPVDELLIRDALALDAPEPETVLV